LVIPQKQTLVSLLLFLPAGKSIIKNRLETVSKNTAKYHPTIYGIINANHLNTVVFFDKRNVEGNLVIDT